MTSYTFSADEFVAVMLGAFALGIFVTGLVAVIGEYIQRRSGINIDDASEEFWDVSDY